MKTLVRATKRCGLAVVVKMLAVTLAAKLVHPFLPDGLANELTATANEFWAWAGR